MGASILAGYGLACVLAASPLFVLQEVTVEASGRPSPGEIRSMSGVRPGMNLLSLDTEDVSRGLETHRWIQHATVVKRLPDRILIKVQEKRPVAVVEIQGDLYYIDREGTVLDGIRPGEPLDFPMITGLEKDVRDAHRWKGGRDVQQALSLLRALQGLPALGIPLPRVCGLVRLFSKDESVRGGLPLLGLPFEFDQTRGSAIFRSGRRAEGGRRGIFVSEGGNNGNPGGF
jgi:hypothetical protein